MTAGHSVFIQKQNFKSLQAALWAALLLSKKILKIEYFYFEQKNINQAVKYLSITYVKMLFICNFNLRYNTVELYSEDVPL